MMNIQDCIDMICNSTKKQLDYAQKLFYRSRVKYDHEKLLSAAENSMSEASKQYLMHRELVRSLYELVPDPPKVTETDGIADDLLGIRIEKIRGVPFTCIKITCPFLLPNKRKPNALFNNAVTETVSSAVRDFVIRHNISPFPTATVIFVSRCTGKTTKPVDNDNKEAGIIINALFGIISDDRSTACNMMFYSFLDSMLPKTEVYIVDSRHDTELLEMIKAKYV